MIVTTSLTSDFTTEFSDGLHRALADTGQQNGGEDAGFHPHDLLEAAVATCINMTVRVYAKNHGLTLTSVKVIVRLDRTVPETAVFRSEVQVQGDNLTEEIVEKLRQIARKCPVSRTLQRSIRFEY